MNIKERIEQVNTKLYQEFDFHDFLQRRVMLTHELALKCEAVDSARLYLNHLEEQMWKEIIQYKKHEYGIKEEIQLHKIYEDAYQYFCKTRFNMDSISVVLKRIANKSCLIHLSLPTSSECLTDILLLTLLETPEVPDEIKHKIAYLDFRQVILEKLKELSPDINID